MKKFFSLSTLLCCALLAGSLTSCDSPYEKKQVEFSKIGDVDSSLLRVGLPLGAKAMHVGEEELTKARFCYFNSHYAAYSALNQEKIDAYIFDSHTLDYVAARTPDLSVLPGSIGKVDIAVGVSPRQKDLLTPINAFIDTYKANGTYEEMYTRWIKLNRINATEYAAPEIPDMPQIGQPQSPTRTLKVGTCSQMEPLCFRKTEDGETTLIGFDMELLQRLALHLNASIELVDLDYVTMMDKLATGEIDIVVAGLNKTAERENRIYFSKNYIDSHIVALVRTSQLKKK